MPYKVRCTASVSGADYTGQMVYLILDKLVSHTPDLPHRGLSSGWQFKVAESCGTIYQETVVLVRVIASEDFLSRSNIEIISSVSLMQMARLYVEKSPEVYLKLSIDHHNEPRV